MVEDLADVLDPPRSRTIGFYVVLCFIVGPFWCTIPVAWIFCLWSFYSGNVWDYNLRWRLALTIALFEVFKLATSNTPSFLMCVIARRHSQFTMYT